MKNNLIILLLSLPVLTCLSQDLRYELHGTYARAIKKEMLNGARSIDDVIPGYPANWITRFISLEIQATCNGKVVKAVTGNNVLSAEQKNILNKADLASDIVINLKYIYQDPVTRANENNTMHVSLTVVPETEAEYIGGKQQLTKYLKESGLSNLPEIPVKPFRLIGPRNTALQYTSIRFTVNEAGDISNAKIFRTSGDSKRDRLLLEAINNMPKWKPAQNSKGIKVKQEFEFNFGNGAGGFYRAGDGC